MFHTVQKYRLIYLLCWNKRTCNEIYTFRQPDVRKLYICTLLLIYRGYKCRVSKKGVIPLFLLRGLRRVWLERVTCAGAVGVAVRAVLRRAGLHRQVARRLRVRRRRCCRPRHQPDPHRDGRHGRQEERLHHRYVHITIGFPWDAHSPLYSCVR